MKKLVVISAVWCPSCLILKKHLKKIMEEYKQLNVTLLDYDLDSDDVEKYDVGDKLPVMIIENDDQELNRLIGEKNYDEIISFLKECDIIWKNILYTF